MSTLREFTGPLVSRRSARCGLALLAAAAALVSACGSGGTSSSGKAASETTAVAAGAQENAVASAAVCYSWPNGTTDAQPCAVGLKGPGGGRVFYDAGSVQPWGRFLEVAPQMWSDPRITCASGGVSCGAADGVPTMTTDFGDSQGHGLCRDLRDSVQADYVAALLLPGEAADTLWEIGGGRHNTEVLAKTPQCVDGSVSAVTLATGYRGGGLSDWYLPSGGELTELCKYTGRNEIGGFLNKNYLSSTVGPKGYYTNPFAVSFTGNPLCERKDVYVRLSGGIYWDIGAVRPIRAFS